MWESSKKGLIFLISSINHVDMTAFPKTGSHTVFRLHYLLNQEEQIPRDNYTSQGLDVWECLCYGMMAKKSASHHDTVFHSTHFNSTMLALQWASQLAFLATPQKNHFCHSDAWTAFQRFPESDVKVLDISSKNIYTFLNLLEAFLHISVTKVAIFKNLHLKDSLENQKW